VVILGKEGGTEGCSPKIKRGMRENMD